jgi:predicted nucleic acid-binding Zn ribbon protein
MSYADDDWDDPDDFPDADEEAAEKGDGTIPCPYCGEDIHADSVRCPHCENYLSREDAPPRGKPLWIALGALAVLAVVLMWILRGM